MKCFKKCLSGILAAILALTALAGCTASGFTYNKKELIAQVGDFDGVVYEDLGEGQASILENILHEELEKLGSDEQYGSPTPFEMFAEYSDYSAGPRARLIDELGISADTRDYWYLSIITLGDFSSVQFKNNLEKEFAENIRIYRYNGLLNLVNERNGEKVPYSTPYSTRGTVSLKIITCSGKQYLVGVWKIAASAKP